VVVCWVGFGGYGIGDGDGMKEGVVSDDCHVSMNEMLCTHILMMRK
jgi:hypothetical protein